MTLIEKKFDFIKGRFLELKEIQAKAVEGDDVLNSVEKEQYEFLTEKFGNTLDGEFRAEIMTASNVQADMEEALVLLGFYDDAQEEKKEEE